MDTSQSTCSSSLIGCISLAVFLNASAVNAAGQPEFEAQTIDDSIKIGYGLAIEDVNGDGRKDILLADAHQIVWYES
ncbi:MAG TPA: hypothetical protein DHV39_09110, partial [Verrucomicrobiales bacterium]|nr:hypothetical protein [Verrucomicrobiales bacterium]